MRPTGDGTGGDLAHIWLLPAEEQVDKQPGLRIVVETRWMTLRDLQQWHHTNGSGLR